MFGYFNEGSIVIANPLIVNGIKYEDVFLRGVSKTDREALSIYPVHELTWDETLYRSTGFAYALVDGEIVGTPALVEIPVEELARLADQKRRSEAIQELAELDRFIPRGVEDLITTLTIDVTTLPQVQQDRLARKTVLRQVINDTNYLNNQ
jgi:hypothetical protein